MKNGELARQGETVRSSQYQNLCGHLHSTGTIHQMATHMGSQGSRKSLERSPPILNENRPPAGKSPTKRVIS